MIAQDTNNVNESLENPIVRAQHVKASGTEGPIIPKQLLWSSNVSRDEKLVWATIREHEGTNTKGYPGLERIAILLDMHRRTAMKLISSLEKKGWLKVDKRSGRENRYECWVVLNDESFNQKLASLKLSKAERGVVHSQCTSALPMHQGSALPMHQGSALPMHPKEPSKEPNKEPIGPLALTDPLAEARTDAVGQVPNSKTPKTKTPSFAEPTEPTDPSKVPPKVPLAEKPKKAPTGPMEVALFFFEAKGESHDPSDKAVTNAALRYLRDSKTLIESAGSIESAKAAIRAYNADYVRTGADYDWGLGPVIKAVPAFKSKGRLSTAQPPSTQPVYNNYVTRPTTPSELTPAEPLPKRVPFHQVPEFNQMVEEMRKKFRPSSVSASIKPETKNCDLANDNIPEPAQQVR